MKALLDARFRVGRVLGAALDRLTRYVPRRTFTDGKTPYLSRWYVFGAPTMADGSAPFDRFGNPKPNARFPEGGAWAGGIHRFHRGDSDAQLHSHPWSWALFFVVAGGYSEERRIGPKVIRRFLPPFSFNWITDKDFHRVDLLGDEAWTFFLAGPKSGSWGFWDRDTGELTPWRDFFAKQGRGVVS